MAYNFKNLADVELLNVMPEEANVLVEVNGTTKRAPLPEIPEVDVTAELVGSEALEEVPEGTTVLAEVNGQIKRVPGGALGEEKWDIKFVFDNNYDDNSFLWNGLTSLEASSLIVETDSKEDVFEKIVNGIPIKACLVGGQGYEGRVYTPVSVSCMTGSGNPCFDFNFMDMNSEYLVAATISCAVQHNSIDVSVHRYAPFAVPQ